MKNGFIVTLLLALLSCSSKPSSNQQSPAQHLNSIATDYVRLGLRIGQYDAAFVDAYYGPDSLKPSGKSSTTFPKDSLINEAKQLITRLASFDTVKNDTLRNRARWISTQLKAFERRIRIFSGELSTFEKETRDLYDVTVPVYNADHFKQTIESLDKILPGKGSINDRFQKLATKFIIPTDKLDTVFKTAISECRKRTLAHVALPANENFKLEYVSNKPWSGYNWYKGNYQSVIQINTDLKIYIDRIIDVGSHESYPGHHVYNMLLEKNLYRDRGYIEMSLYPLYSPQSLIGEGTANEGIEIVFPGREKINFAKSVLLPLAGLDTVGITKYFEALKIRGRLNYSRNEIARGLMNKTMDEKEAIRQLKEYALMNEETAIKSIEFIRTNRSYVVNYNYGKDMAHNFIVSHGGDDDEVKRWEAFLYLLDKQVLPSSLTGSLK